MKNPYYVRGEFRNSDEAWSHLEAHWAEDNPQVARRLDWEGLKAEYATALYWERRWHLIRELTDYTERQPTPQGAKEVIATCPSCRKSALVQRGRYPVKGFYVHLMGKKDNGEEVPLKQHLMQPDRGGIIDASSI